MNKFLYNSLDAVRDIKPFGIGYAHISDDLRCVLEGVAIGVGIVAISAVIPLIVFWAVSSR